MQGREIDMEKLMKKHELMPAVGNTRVNARGDELGPGGKIIRKREDVVSDYYEDNPQAQVVRSTPVGKSTEPTEVNKSKKSTQAEE
jgi:hypothetical protein